jgi:hypothetical protein
MILTKSEVRVILKSINEWKSIKSWMFNSKKAKKEPFLVGYILAVDREWS